MSSYNQSAISLCKPVLLLSGFRVYAFQFSLIGASVILPLIAHLSGAPVRYFLPIHWSVFSAGFIYSWRSGASTGFLAPILSYFISGFPLPSILPSMTLELLTYGLVAGFLRERTAMNPWLSMVIALVVGRTVFITSVLLENVVTTNHLEYFQAAFLPGLIAGLGQIALLPMLANWWIRHEQRDTINKEG